jgi:hypothetical protein
MSFKDHITEIMSLEGGKYTSSTLIEAGGQAYVYQVYDSSR